MVPLQGCSQNTNVGSKTFVKISDDITHVLVKFSQTEIDNAIGSKRLISAKLELFIETNFNTWPGGGELVDVHRLTEDWTELGSTWNCSNDTNTANSIADCTVDWDGGSRDATPTVSVLHQNNQTGWKSFDVTTDVDAFVYGTANYGWVIKKKDLNGDGR